MTQKSIFLCHSSKDKFFVRELAENLKTYGIKVWLDEAEINIGDSLTEKIGQAIDETDYVGVVLSTNSVNSQWVQKELQVALQKEFSKKQVVVLPMLLESVAIPPFLRDKLYADFTSLEKFEETFPRFLRSLGIAEEKIKPIGEPRAIKKEFQVSAVLTTAERLLADFEDIHIVGLDENRSNKPNAKSPMQNIFLKLSGPPPSEWKQIFEAERRFPRHTMWRTASIEEQYIVIFCVPEELEKYHFSDLQQDVTNSNDKYRHYLMQLAQKEAKERNKEQEEQEKLKMLKKRLGLE